MAGWGKPLPVFLLGGNMKLQALQSLVNNNLAGETLSYNKMKPFLDNVLDDINDDLGSIYPVFSELESSVDEYTAFPDKYLRQVVAIGAAWYFFLVDEEGISTAETLQQLYQYNLFKMQRDLVGFVPEEYQKPEPFGTIDASSEGVTISGSTWRL